LPLRYQCDRCHGLQRIPHPMWRYMPAPDAFGTETWACQRCHDFTHWRVCAVDTDRIRAPPSCPLTASQPYHVITRVSHSNCAAAGRTHLPRVRHSALRVHVACACVRRGLQCPTAAPEECPESWGRREEWLSAVRAARQLQLRQAAAEGIVARVAHWPLPPIAVILCVAVLLRMVVASHVRHGHGCDAPPSCGPQPSHLGLCQASAW
jgi:hypothetical protein